MKIIGGPRQSGRTTRLIELCAESQSNGSPSYIITHSETEAHRIFSQSLAQNTHIAFPLTYDEFFGFHGYPANYTFFIDNVELLLLKLLKTPYNIGAIAITVDENLLPKVATLIQVPIEFSKLRQHHIELARKVETGRATSSVTLAFGCGHWFQRQNGDSLYATCPLCYIRRPTSTI